GQTSVAISRYEYNFGQALMEGRGGAEALPHYLASFKADPSFLPAADAILIAVRTITEPDIGVQAIKSITDISLQRSDTVGAAEYLRVGLMREDWRGAKEFPDLLVELVRLFTDIGLDEASFRFDWASTVETVAQSSTQGAALRAKSIVIAYTGN